MKIQMSDRVQRLRERSLSSNYSLCSERAGLVTESFKKSEAYPRIQRRALALQNVLANKSIYLAEDELIVGSQSSGLNVTPVFPEYAVKWLVDEIDTLDKRPVDPFYVKEEDKSIFKDIAAYWDGKTLQDRILQTIPEDVLTAMEMNTLLGHHLMSSGDGHIIIDFKKVLGQGLRGVLKDIEKNLNTLDISNPSDAKKRAFLLATKMVCESANTYAKRYAGLAGETAKNETDPKKKKELQMISDICEYVPENPVRSFREALQSIWFIQLVLQLESNGHGVSLGRFDQYLFPYYKADLENGIINRDEALELVMCLYLKFHNTNKVRPLQHTQYAAGYNTWQNVTIGGQTFQDGDVTNDLTYLCLDAMELLKLPAPTLSARYHANSPERYLRRCAEIISTGFGMPGLENDEVIIPSLMMRGVKPEDAYEYGMVGCVEVSVPGKWGYRCNGMTFMNMAKILEVTLNGGKDPNSGRQLLVDNNNLTTFENFEDLLSAYHKQIQYYTNLQIRFDNTVDIALEELCPDPFCSSLVQDCIGRGKTIKEGGAVYDMVSGVQAGIANVANSLAAIKKLVFEAGVLSKEELAQALASDFEGPKGEEIRQMLLNKAPKYGNDDDYVDTLAKEAYNYYINEIENYRNTRFGRGPIGGTFYSSSSTISSNVPAGKAIGATPDGRKAGMSLAEGASPYPGTDVKGPTAVLKSITKLPSMLMTGGQLLNIKFSPQVLQSQHGIDYLVEIIRGFSRLKGWHIQVNVIAAETLRDAQKNPEKHRNLVVRVAGYCAFFTELNVETQEDIIRRTEHAI